MVEKKDLRFAKSSVYGATTAQNESAGSAKNAKKSLRPQGSKQVQFICLCWLLWIQILDFIIRSLIILLYFIIFRYIASVIVICLVQIYKMRNPMIRKGFAIFVSKVHLSVISFKKKNLKSNSFSRGKYYLKPWLLKLEVRKLRNFYIGPFL